MERNISFLTHVGGNLDSSWNDLNRRKVSSRFFESSRPCGPALHTVDGAWGAIA